MAYIISGLIIIAMGGFIPLFFKKGSIWGDRIAVLTVLMGEVLIIPQTIQALLWNAGNPLSYNFLGLDLEMDSLATLFLLVISVISGIIAVYAEGYLRPYRNSGSDTRINFLFFNLLIVSMSLLMLVTDVAAFLTVWEMMSLTSFMLILFHHEQPDVRKAGLKYFVTMHVGFVFLAGGFLGAGIGCGSTAFKDIADFFSARQSTAFPLIILLIIGFAFKAGFIPVHFWLPDAHPAAPTHVSALMSGVMIKTGIYGILRTMLLFSEQSLNLGLILLGIGAFSGIYGILHALSQRDIKKMLAYSSVENIGIIGIGIGVGVIGKATGNEIMTVLGFAGALLHTVNHSIFKSLLFCGAGIVYQATHTRDLEHLGGLIKELPWTASGCLMGTAAISGLPPLNGFISEFLIYLALLNGVSSTAAIIRFPAMIGIIALVLIGGLAVACFTKLFGMVFLGLPRRPKEIKFQERAGMIVPLLLLAGFTLLIGLFPFTLIALMTAPIRLITGIEITVIHSYLTIIKNVNLVAWIFLLVLAILTGIRLLCFKNNKAVVQNTWGCGYSRLNSRMEYTGSSLVNSITFLFGRFLERDVVFEKPQGLFPAAGIFRSLGKDKIEETGIQPLIDWMRLFLRRFNWIQHGNLQHYIWYGLIFMIVTIIFALRG